MSIDIDDFSKDKENLGFAFGIRPQRDANGNIVAFNVQSENRGIHDEVIITIVRNWLRAIEENYFKRFTGKIQIINKLTRS